MEYLILYLFMISSGIKGLFIAVGLVSLAGSVVAGMFCFFEQIEASKTVKGRLVAGLIVGAISVLIPEKKDIAMIIAGGVTYQALTSEPAKELGGKSLKLLNQKLDDYLNESKEGENK